MKRKEEKIDGERNRGLGGGEVRGVLVCTVHVKLALWCRLNLQALLCTPNSLPPAVCTWVKEEEKEYHERFRVGH